MTRPVPLLPSLLTAVLLEAARAAWSANDAGRRDRSGRPSTLWSAGGGCGGETEVDQRGVAGRCGVAAGQDERPGSLVGAAGGLERGGRAEEAFVVVVEQRGGPVEDRASDGVPGDDRAGGGEMVGGVGVAGQHGGFGSQGGVPVQQYPGEPQVRLVGWGVEPFQGECGLSMVEQGDGVEGGRVAGSVFGSDAHLVDDGEPFGLGGLVT